MTRYEKSDCFLPSRGVWLNACPSGQFGMVQKFKGRLHDVLAFCYGRESKVLRQGLVSTSKYRLWHKIIIEALPYVDINIKDKYVCWIFMITLYLFHSASRTSWFCLAYCYLQTWRPFVWWQNVICLLTKADDLHTFLWFRSPFYWFTVFIKFHRQRQISLNSNTFVIDCFQQF